MAGRKGVISPSHRTAVCVAESIATARMSEAEKPAPSTARVFSQSADSQSAGDCSQAPGAGCAVGYSTACCAAMLPCVSNSVTLEEPPPKSIPSKYFIVFSQEDVFGKSFPLIPFKTFRQSPPGGTDIVKKAFSVFAGEQAPFDVDASRQQGVARERQGESAQR